MIGVVLQSTLGRSSGLHVMATATQRTSLPKWYGEEYRDMWDSASGITMSSPSGQGPQAGATEHSAPATQWIVFYYATTGSILLSLLASSAFIIGNDREMLETCFIYLVARKVGLPTSWITLSLPDQLHSRMPCKLRVACALSHPLVCIYQPFGTCCVVCGDTPGASGAELWYHESDACIRCEQRDLVAYAEFV